MGDAPERIIAIKDRKFGWPNGYTEAAPAEPIDDRNPVEYVRADLHEALEAEVARLRGLGKKLATQLAFVATGESDKFATLRLADQALVILGEIDDAS